MALTFVDAVSFHLRNRNNGSIVSSGENREYLLYVPESYDSTSPTPLVISMHGGGLWPAQQMNLSHWNRLADENGFIVVYPWGAGYPRKWETFDAADPDLERDVRFISELIDKLQSAYNIDRARIYANGLSNGGGMAFVLSCTLSERIAAVGMVAAAQTLPPRLVYEQSTGTDDFVSWRGRPHCVLQRRGHGRSRGNHPCAARVSGGA